MAYKKLLIFFILLAMLPVSFSLGSELKFLYSDVGFGHACTYYELTNPYIATIDFAKQPAQDRLQISEWNEVYGKMKNSYWEELITTSYNEKVWKPNLTCQNISNINGSVTETCVDKGKYETVTKYKNEWKILDEEKMVMTPKETKKLRFCGDYDMVKTENGWTVKIDHIPQFLGVKYDGTKGTEALAWWNAFWSYCVDISTTDSFVENFTHIIVLNATNTDYSHMQSDGADIRFLEGSCDSPDTALGELGQWNWTWNNTGESKLLVKTTNNSGNISSIAMYYGNPSASATWNISKATAFGDDFGDANLDASKWYERLNAGAYSEANGILQITTEGGDTKEAISSLDTTNVSSPIKVYMDITLDTDTKDRPIINVAGVGNNGLIQTYYLEANGGKRYKSYTDGLGSFTEIARPTKLIDYSDFEVWINSSIVQFWINDTLNDANITSNIGSGGWTIEFMGRGDPMDIRINHTFFRRANPDFSEPTYTFGAEQTSADPYFTSPTPANNTNNFTYPITLNMTDSSNSSFSSGSVFEIDGTNYTCTIASDNKSCSYTLTYAQHIFNNTYTFKGFGNISGTFYETNETYTVPYYGCGYVNADGTLLGNVSISGSTCFTINASNIVFNGAGYSIDGDGGNGHGILNSYMDNIIISNFTIKNFSRSTDVYTYSCIDIYSTSLNNTISNNILSYCSSGITTGATCNNLNITNNTIFNTSFGGIYFRGSSGYIQNNTIYSINNGKAITIDSSGYSNNTIRNNVIYDFSGTYAIYLVSNNNYNYIYNNNFTNASASFDSESNFWNTTKDCTTPNIIGGSCIGGNYYSSLGCVDEDFDGICDNPNNYTISGGSNIDYLPLSNINRSMVKINNIYSINQNSSRDKLSVGDTLLYAFGILELNYSGSSENIKNYEFYIEPAHWYNDSNANSSWKKITINLNANSLTNISNFEFRIPLTKSTSDGDVGAYSHFHYPHALQYTFAKNYTRSIYNVTAILPYPEAQTSGFQLYRCNLSSCDAETSGHWSESLTFTYNTTTISRSGDYFDDLVYIISYDTRGSSGGGGTTQESSPPEEPPEEEETKTQEETTEETTPASGWIAEKIKKATNGDIRPIDGYTCGTWLSDTGICGLGLVDTFLCEWKGILSLYIPKLKSPLNILLALFGFMGIIIFSKEKNITQTVYAIIILILLPVNFGLSILLFLISLAIIQENKSSYLYTFFWIFIIITFWQGIAFIVFVALWFIEKIQMGELLQWGGMT